MWRDFLPIRPALGCHGNSSGFGTGPLRCGGRIKSAHFAAHSRRTHFDRRRGNATARLRSTSTNDRLVARQKSNHSNRLGRSRFRSGRVSDLRDYLAQLREKHRHQVAGRGQHGKCSLRMHASRHQLHHTGSEAESARGNHNQLNIRVSLFRRRDQRLHCYSGAAPRRSRRGSYQCEARKHRSSK